MVPVAESSGLNSPNHVLRATAAYTNRPPGIDARFSRPWTMGRDRKSEETVGLFPYPFARSDDGVARANLASRYITRRAIYLVTCLLQQRVHAPNACLHRAQMSKSVGIVPFAVERKVQ
jgi:hypothetical protein